MPRWYRIVSAGATWLGRLYGVFFLALGSVFLYWGGRGLLAFAKGVRAPWSDPAYCAIGLVAGVLGLWAGSHLVRDAKLAKEYAGGRGLSDELAQAIDEADKLDETDPATHDVDSAVVLRRTLQKKIEINALFRKDVLKNVPEDQRAPMLVEIEEADRRFQSELLELERTIPRRKLR